MFVSLENAAECRQIMREFLEILGDKEFTSSQYKEARSKYCMEHNQMIYDSYYRMYRPKRETSPYCLSSMIDKGYIVKTGEEVFMRKGSIYRWKNEEWDADWKVHRYYCYLADCNSKLTREEFFKEVHEVEKDIPATRFLYMVNWPKMKKVLGE